MPQEAWVLQCCCCRKFQVQLKKIIKKWQCKVCGKKQDVIQIFFTGSPKGCRVTVQNLNLARGLALEKENGESDCLPDNDNEEEEEEEAIRYEMESSEFSLSDQMEESIQSGPLCKGSQEDNQISWSLPERNNLRETLKSKQNIESSRNCNNSAMQSQCNFKHKLDEESENKENSDLDPDFDINELIFKATQKSKKRKEKYVPKLSIFESNGDINESLDF